MDRKIILIFVVLSVSSATIGAMTVQILNSNNTTNQIGTIGNHQENNNILETNNNSILSQSTVTSSQYSRLYKNTIDSVVMVRTITLQGYSIGSGFIYDNQGHIVTNEHVVNNAEQVFVRFRDGTWKSATIIGTDVYTDLAVLKVQNIPRFTEPLQVADNPPRPGQPVAALGSPFGLEGSITSGIVSGLNRSMSTSRGFSIPATIQIDAPLNPGNSGGPLLNMNGTVIGVNRAKEGDNIGFAISPLLVNRVVPELIEDGSYSHPYLGVRTVSLTPIRARANNLENSEGVLVVDTIEGRPADGVLEPSTSTTIIEGISVPLGGDVIVSINGYEIESQQDLSRYLMLHTRPGEKINISVIRDGENITVNLTLDERPELT